MLALAQPEYIDAIDTINDLNFLRDRAAMYAKKFKGSSNQQDQRQYQFWQHTYNEINRVAIRVATYHQFYFRPRGA